MTFLVPAPEERVIVATLQRMYRHFYFRVCDIVNTAGSADRMDSLDFGELKKAADTGRIWPGVATYLKIVCDYVRDYRGDAPELPSEVLAAARFGGDVIHARGKFLRVPFCPTAPTSTRAKSPTPPCVAMCRQLSDCRCFPTLRRPRRWLFGLPEAIREFGEPSAETRHLGQQSVACRASDKPTSRTMCCAQTWCQKATLLPTFGHIAACCRCDMRMIIAASCGERDGVPLVLTTCWNN